MHEGRCVRASQRKTRHLGANGLMDGQGSTCDRMLSSRLALDAFNKHLARCRSERARVVELGLRYLVPHSRLARVFKLRSAIQPVALAHISHICGSGKGAGRGGGPWEPGHILGMESDLPRLRYRKVRGWPQGCNSGRFDSTFSLSQWI